MHIWKLLWIYCLGNAGVKGKDQADRVAGKATLTNNLCLKRSEMLRSLKHWMWTLGQGHHTIHRLEERSVERRSTEWSSLKGWERVIIGQTLKPFQGQCWDRVERIIMSFLKCIDIIFTWTELNWKHSWCLCPYVYVCFLISLSDYSDVTRVSGGLNISGFFLDPEQIRQQVLSQNISLTPEALDTLLNASVAVNRVWLLITVRMRYISQWSLQQHCSGCCSRLLYPLEGSEGGRGGREAILYKLDSLYLVGIPLDLCVTCCRCSSYTCIFQTCLTSTIYMISWMQCTLSLHFLTCLTRMIYIISRIQCTLFEIDEMQMGTAFRAPFFCCHGFCCVFSFVTLRQSCRSNCMGHRNRHLYHCGVGWEKTWHFS